MLPTKGFFQDIECPYLENGCGRPYCHFRHRKKLNEENTNEPVAEVPTYKPTPKSELANIQNNRSHIPISYVPDLAFRPDRTTRSLPKFDKPTYKPTPLSILSASKTEENGQTQTIKELKQDIASNEYNPLLSLKGREINFEDLSSEFDILESIIKESDPLNGDNVVTYSPTKIKDLESTSESKKLGEKPSDEPVKNEHSDKVTKSSSDKHKSRDKHSSGSSREKSHRSSHDKSHKSSSSRDKHRKEEKKDSKSSDRSKDKHKDKHKVSSSSSKKDKQKKEHDKSKSKSKEKEKSKKHKRKKSSSSDHNSDDTDDEKNRRKHKSSKDDAKVSKKSKPKVSSESDANEEPDIVLSDVDLDNEDETLMECYKIFNEYKPTPKPLPEPEKKGDIDKPGDPNDDLIVGKKRVAHLNADTSLTQTKFPSASKSKPAVTPGQTLANRYKIAKQAQANKEQENIVNEVKQPVLPVKRPPPTLLEAARQHKIRKMHTPNTGSTNLVDDIINGRTAAVKPPPVRKIAPVQNFMSYQRAKERINEIAKQKAANIMSKTVAQTQKSGRVAHVPEISLSDIPDVLHIDKSKLPVNVRTRFLTMIADECVKLYLTKDDAYERALNEEFSCYEKCKVLATYRNSAMLAVNRLRKEIQEREKTGLGPIDSGESSTTEKISEYSGKKFYNHMKPWILTDEELETHGYPREDVVPGKAVIKNRRDLIDTTLGDNERKCCRCNKIYQVDDDGWPLYDEECLYHPLKKRTIRGEQTYLCCRSTDATGCATSDTHVSESLYNHELEGFQSTMEPEQDNDPRSVAVYALDCEMCYTTKGLELTRVTIVDTECRTVYESLVKPLNPIIDYNTRFSGITKEQMDKTSTSILQIQANILHLCNSQTILVGHSLESDLKALKIIHNTVIDTSVLFPHKMGLPHKRALKALASEYLKKIIQNDVSGHDSAEDALTCMELIKWKLKEDLKLRGK